MDNPLIMYQSCRIILAVKLRHLKDIFSAKGFISTGPDQDRRVVLVTLIHGIYTVQHHAQPFRFVVRNDIRVISGKFCYIPGSVRLQIVFCDHVNTIFIAETVDWRCIRIMTGTDCIDVVLFHDHDVFEQFLTGHMSSCDGAELMAVHTLEYDTFSVQCHNTVFHLKAAESDFLRNNFLYSSICIRYSQFQII